MPAPLREPSFPTAEHAEAAGAVVEYASTLDGVDTVLVVNSCARGNAVPDSDLDMAVLMDRHVDDAEMEASWLDRAALTDAVHRFEDRGPFSHVHLDFFDGTFEPLAWDDGGGPDDFEIEVGNRVAFAVPFEIAGARFESLRRQWLPYYGEALRLERLEMVRAALLYDLDHVPFFTARGLFLQAFDRLYKALREFLQALFIAHRQYPVAYNKWLDEQLGWIDRRDLRAEVLNLLTLGSLDGNTLEAKTARLRALERELSEVLRA